MSSFKQLGFGTSGIRGLVTDMTDRECYINTKGFVGFLRERGEIGKGSNAIAVGGDLRSSTPRVMAAVIKAIKDSGCSVEFCGRVPTPTLAYYAIEKGLPSIMVTGSHVPDDRNGIKFTKRSGEVLKSDEEAILRNVAASRKEEDSRPAGKSIFNAAHMFKEKTGLPVPGSEAEAVSMYVSRYLDVFPKDALKGAKVVLYKHSAVGRDILEKVFKGLGAVCQVIGKSDVFIPVDTEKIADSMRDMIKAAAREYEPFAILSTDGDSDRPLLADEKGDILPGDKLGALVSIYLEPDFAAIPISTNDSVLGALRSKGVRFVQTKIGSPYVIKAMNDKLAEDRAAKVVSWEANGGFLLGSDWTIGGRTLKALATRDAVLPLVAALLLARKEGKALSELIARSLPARYTHADVVDDKTKGCGAYTAEMGKEIIKKFSPSDGEVVQLDFEKGGVKRFLKNGAAKISEKNADNEALDLKRRLETYFNADDGLDNVVSVNFMDGIRIKFACGDVAHLRPSGNAPEFRLYATADTKQRAEEIVRKRLEIVPRMITDITKDKG